MFNQSENENDGAGSSPQKNLRMDLSQIKAKFFCIPEKKFA